MTELPENYDLELWTPDRVLVGESHNGGTADESTVYVVRDIEGEYRVRVMGVAGAADKERPYHLTIEVITTLPPPFVVNTTADHDDGSCDALEIGDCTLREAINAVNAGDGRLRTIEFDIPTDDAGFDGTVWTIQPSSPLPALTQGVDLDATTQTANQGDTNLHGPEIVLDGSLLALEHGLVVDDTRGSTIRGLVISNWDAGVRIQGGRENSIKGCYVGTDHTGEDAAGNGDGIVLDGGNYQRVGGDEPGEGNLISGNASHGLWLNGARACTVKGNLIGTDRSGMAALGNGGDGIHLSAGAQDNILGGRREREGNLISGNGGSGVEIFGSGTHGNILWGNRIGTNADVTGTLGNGGSGVVVQSSDHNTIGRALLEWVNIIGGNDGSGVYLMEADHNTVTGNFIGAEPRRLFHLGNDMNGVAIEDGSQYNTIGPDNVIAHNGGDGVLVSGLGTTRNTITENSITDNGGLGINNVTGGNEELTPPIVSLVTTTYARGTACPLCQVEVFSDPADEGMEYHGSTIAETDSTWSVGLYGAWPNVHATATDDEGNTSEFSVCRDEYEPNDDFDQAIEISAGDEIESYICHPDDVDYFQFPVTAGSVITVELDAPHPYHLSLYDPDRGLLGERWGSSTVSYTALEGGDYFVGVDGAGYHDADAPYTLRVTMASLSTHLRLWIDEGWIGDPAVYKVIPDADDPADVTYVDVVVEVTTETTEQFPVFVVVDIPDDQFGPPIYVRDRYCTGCATGADKDWISAGSGRYLAALSLLRVYTAQSYGQLVFRFGIGPGVSPGDDVVASAELRYAIEGSPVATASAPYIHLVDSVPAIIITSRHHLYETHYHREEAAQLLGEVTQAAQGRGAGPDGSLLATIYYVDDYSTEARDWDNTIFDYSSETHANVTCLAIDALLEDWVDDATDGTVLILGDDDVIPFYRKKSFRRGKESEHGDTDPVLNRVVSHDFFFSDNQYADTNHRDISHGNLELNIGRIVGDTAADMLSLFQGGLSGPNYGPSPRAVLASWDGHDLHFATRDGVLEWVRNWGFSASSALVDNGDWRRDDLLDALREQFSLFIFADHGNPYGLGTPPSKKRGGVEGSDIAAAVSGTAPLHQPFYGFDACRVGFTLVNNGVIDRLIREGASGFVASAGISFGSPEGSEWFTEQLSNMFWHRFVPEDGMPETAGYALRRAKLDYHPPHHWFSYDKRAVMELTLFGVPWMWLPRIDGTTLSSGARAAPTATSFSSPQAASANTYLITATIDASNYSITQPVPGFDLIEVEGFEQSWFNGPMLPSQDLSFPLSLGAEINSVSVQFDGEISLGALNVPSYTLGVPLYPDGADPEWNEIPPEVGIIPTEPYTYHVKDIDSHLVTYVHLIPVVYEAASDQATLYQQITVSVTYTSPVALAITDLYLGAPPHAPGEAVTAQAEVINVSDMPVVFTTTLRLVDVYGDEVSVTAGGPFTVPAGSSEVIGPTFSAPNGESSYHARLTIWQDGEAIAQASDVLQVVAAQITAFDGPDSLMPGETAVFTVTLANYTTSALETEFALSLSTEWGKPVASLTPQTQTVPAGGQVTVTFAWDSAAASPDGYQATALVTPAGYDPRSLSRLLQVRRLVYLPLILKADQAAPTWTRRGMKATDY